MAISLGVYPIFRQTHIVDKMILLWLETMEIDIGNQIHPKKYPVCLGCRAGAQAINVCMGKPGVRCGSLHECEGNLFKAFTHPFSGLGLVSSGTLLTMSKKRFSPQIQSRVASRICHPQALPLDAFT